MLKKLRRLAEFSPGERLLLLQLTVFSLAAGVGLRLGTLPRLMGFIARCVENRQLRCLPLLHSRYEAARLAVLADMAARVIPGQGRCLIRSLLLLWMLKARGEPVELFIGISKEATTLHGHAWIEAQGRVMGDSLEMTEHFVTLLRF